MNQAILIKYALTQAAKMYPQVYYMVHREMPNLPPPAIMAVTSAVEEINTIRQYASEVADKMEHDQERLELEMIIALFDATKQACEETHIPGLE